MCDNKIKILRITPCVNVGSISRTGEQLGKLVLEQGWESYIAYTRAGGKSASKLVKVGNKFSIYSHALLARLFDACGYGSYFATKKFVSNLKNIKPDIVHLHNIHNYDVNIKVLFEYFKESGVPVVWTQHDSWTYTGHCAFYAEPNCKKWKTECHDCPLYKEYPNSWFFDRSRQNFRYKKNLFTSLNSDNLYIVCVSNYIKNDASQSFLNKYPVSRIFNGIDMKIFRPCNDDVEIRKIREKFYLGNGELLMATGTAWTERKGISDYRKLRKVLSEEYTIVLVGVSKSLTATFPEGIIGVERTDSIEEMAQLYSTASIVMNLSNAESFGKTTPEGLACGIPGIVYNCTASPELVDSKTGVVVEKGDIDGILKAIETISMWDKYETAKACRERASLLFDMDKNWNEYIELYKQILRQKHKL